MSAAGRIGPRARARSSILAAAASLALALPCTARAQQGRLPHAELMRQGENVYLTFCVGCHGEKGDGNGPAAEMLIVKPRDFTMGLFKFRSTPNGTLPTDEDLLRTVTLGINRTSMPEWSLLPERERVAVVAYVKGFYPRWQEEGAGTPIFIPAPPPTLGSPESVARGKQLYEMLDCGRCHGSAGRGDGPSAATLAPDSWGNPQKPFDFTKGALKGGPAAEDVYRTFMTGLNGTAMPSYADVFDNPDGESIHPGDAWNLVSYILSLRTKSKPSAPEMVARREPAS